MGTSVVLGPLTPLKPMHTSPKTMEEYRQSVRAWHLSKQRDTLAGIWDEPEQTQKPVRTPPRSAISEDEEFGMRTSKRAINPITGLPFVKSPATKHVGLPEPLDARTQAPSPRARVRDPSGMKSVYRTMAVYEDKPVSPRTAKAAPVGEQRTPTRDRNARTSTSTQSSTGDLCNAARPPVLSASCSSCSSSSIASTRTDFADQSVLPTPIDLGGDDGLPLNMSNLAMANEMAVQSEQSSKRNSGDTSIPSSPYGVYAGGIIDLNTPARTPPTSNNRSRSATVYPIIIHPSSRDPSPTPSRPRNIRHLTAGTDMTEESNSTSGESFAGLMDSPRVTPGIMPGTGKKSGNRLSAEIGRIFAKQAASNSAAAASAFSQANTPVVLPGALVAPSPPQSGRTVAKPPSEPASPACEAPPELRFNAVEPHVGHSSAGSTPSSEELEGMRTSPARRMFRNMTFQRPHSKSERAKGRGGNWTCEEAEAM